MRAVGGEFQETAARQGQDDPLAIKMGPAHRVQVSPGSALDLEAHRPHGVPLLDLVVDFHHLLG